MLPQPLRAGGVTAPKAMARRPLQAPGRRPGMACTCAAERRAPKATGGATNRAPLSAAKVIGPDGGGDAGGGPCSPVPPPGSGTRPQHEAQQACTCERRKKTGIAGQAAGGGPSTTRADATTGGRTDGDTHSPGAQSDALSVFAPGVSHSSEVIDPVPTCNVTLASTRQRRRNGQSRRQTWPMRRHWKQNFPVRRRTHSGPQLSFAFVTDAGLPFGNGLISSVEAFRARRTVDMVVYPTERHPRSPTVILSKTAVGSNCGDEQQVWGDRVSSKPGVGELSVFSLVDSGCI